MFGRFPKVFVRGLKDCYLSVRVFESQEAIDRRFSQVMQDRENFHPHIRKKDERMFQLLHELYPGVVLSNKRHRSTCITTLFEGDIFFVVVMSIPDGLFVKGDLKKYLIEKKRLKIKIKLYEYEVVRLQV
jgi:CYTH domain-containing protein